MAGTQSSACALNIGRLHEHIVTVKRIAPNSPD
jgi:hypothetical protein